MIKENINIVAQVLGSNPEARDSDIRLYESVLKDIGLDLELMSVKGLLERIGADFLPSFDSISRARRKVQQDCPELRGKNYLKRHKLQEEVKAELL